MLSIEDVCEALKTRGGFTGSYHTLVHYVREFLGEMAYQLADGYAVNTGFFSIHPRVGGLFRNEHESPAGRPVKFSFLPREPMQRLGESITIGVEDGNMRDARIDRFMDIGTGAVNSTLKPGSQFILYGYKIRIKGDNPQCGVYFVSTKDEARRYRVKCECAVNTNSKIVSLVPALPPGEYRIAVLTQYTIGGKNLKNPKTIESGFTVRCTG
jgi:hypothetical protein